LQTKDFVKILLDAVNYFNDREGKTKGKILCRVGINVFNQLKNHL